MAVRRSLAALGVLAALAAFGATAAAGGDKADILAQSMAAWRGYEDRMAR
jgi:hypothetical protein